ncbi:MAG: Mrp/NBP35 family ATP-binding protein [Actinomycetota bacterium]|nr:Mrp/NBP35 family ATP-binding protein [Actinomycetota bacterium]
MGTGDKTYVLAVASGKGGVGKSTVSVNLAVALTQTGSKVGLLDADIYGPDVALMVGITRRRPAKSLTVWRNPAAGGGRIEALERFGVKIMSTQFLVAEDQALSWSMPLVDLLLQRLTHDVDWGEPDFLVVDLPPGTADVQQRLAAHLRLSGALVVVTPQDLAHLDAKKVLAMFGQLDVPVLGGVENMSGLRCGSCGSEVDVFPRVASERSIWAAGVRQLARLPLDPIVAESAERGVPLVKAHPETVHAEAFRALAARIRGYPEGDGGHHGRGGEESPDD